MDLRLREMELADIKHASELWTNLYARVRQTRPESSPYWVKHQEQLRSELRSHVQAGRAAILEIDGELVGYMFYDSFLFHGNKSAFCPIMGHAVKPHVQKVGYTRLYQYLAERWVDEGCLDHFLTFFACNGELQDLLYYLGFGAYLMDAFRHTKPVSSLACSVNFVQATPDHVVPLRVLEEASLQYYNESPLFLGRSCEDSEDLEALLRDSEGAVFLAFSGDQPIGFMNVRCNDQPDPINLADPQTAMLDPLGAYILPCYRGQNVGMGLLGKCVGWAQERGLERIHVDFETANIFGRPFWLKHFQPVLLSVRRRVNADVVALRKQDAKTKLIRGKADSEK